MISFAIIVPEVMEICGFLFFFTAYTFIYILLRIGEFAVADRISASVRPNFANFDWN